MRLVVGVTGATGAPFAVRILECLRDAGVETHLVVSPWGRRTFEHETGQPVAALEALAAVVHSVGDQGATLSSGSFRTDGMVIAPCSVRTLAAIAGGLADNLVTRAADVVLKERRPLVLLVREAPLSPIHLENMLKLSRLDVTMFPPVPAFYNHPASVADIVDHVAMRALDQFGLELPLTRRWNGQVQRHPAAPATSARPAPGAAPAAAPSARPPASRA